MTNMEIVKAGWWALDMLDAAGLMDSSAAEAIRDALDEPWLSMSKEEQIRLVDADPLIGHLGRGINALPR